MTCASCGMENPGEARFCNQCGTALLDSAAAVADPGERRLVTALFADLVGFTEFSAAHDVEDTRAMLVRWFDRARGVVEGLGGVIDKYTGDAVTAFWGARTSHEDDAERAVRAGLRLVDAATDLGAELGIDDLRVRVGVATGETSVGTGGNLTGLVVGDLVNVAARLQPIAEPGTVVVSDSTRSLTAGAVEFESLGRPTLKGVAEPVEVHRAVRLAGGAPRQGGPAPPFVGRIAELGLLEDHHRATVSESRARLVSIVGEAGIGKSRLAAEAEDRMGTSEHWYTGRSTVHRDGSIFGALADIVRQIAGIAEGSDEGGARLVDAVEAAVDDAVERRWVTPRLAGVLDYQPLPAGDRDDLFGGVRLFLQRTAEAGALTLVFDEVQWADDALLDLLVDLVERSPRHPILVVTLARPEMLERRPDWGAAHHRFTSVHLGPIADGDIDRLVAGMAPGIDPETIAQIVGAAAGVPLYAVEYVRMLVGTGALVPDGAGYRRTEPVGSLRMPDSLQAVVGARLDRLGEEDRSLVTDAAVLGDEFPMRHLGLVTSLDADALRPRVDRLVRQGILEVDHGPNRSESARFVQSTIRELAHRRLSRDERHRRHLEVAEGLDRMSEPAGVVATHYLEALEARHDPDVVERAAGSLLATAKRAADLHSLRQALDLVERAVGLAADDATRLPFWEVGADAASATRDHRLAEDLARRALDHHLAAGDADQTLAARVRLARVLVIADESRRAIEDCGPHFDVGRGGEKQMAELGRLLARAHVGMGESETAAGIARDLLVTSADIDDRQLVATLLQDRGYALHQLGRTRESAALIRDAVRIASELDAPGFEAQMLSTLVWVEGRDGRRRDLAVPERMLQMATLAGEPPLLRRATAWVARIRMAEGLYREARELYASQDWSHQPRADERYDWSRARYLDWIIDGDLDALDEAESFIDAPGSTSAEGASIVLSAKGQYAYARGDAERAYELATQPAPSMAVPHSFIHDLPILAALRLGDVDRLERARERVPAAAGRRFASLRRLGDASIALLRDRSTDAVARYVDVADHHGRVDGPGDEAQLLAILGGLLPDDANCRAQADRARQWFAGRDAGGYLQLYADCWPGSRS